MNMVNNQSLYYIFIKIENIQLKIQSMGVSSSHDLSLLSDKIITDKMTDPVLEFFKNNCTPKEFTLLIC